MIEVGEWIHVEPNKLLVNEIIPTQLNQHKNRVQEPYFFLRFEDKEILVNGRKLFWSLLDSLFYDDPLPRIFVNDFLQEEPHNFVKDLNEFFQESNTPYISIMLGEVPDPISTIGGMYHELGASIITFSSSLKAPDCVEIANKYNGLVIPGTWKDSKGSHEIPCVLIDGNIHISDLGNTLVVGGVIQNEHGDNVRPLEHDVVRKGVGWPLKLQECVKRHQEAVKISADRIYPPIKIDKNQATSRVMNQEHDLYNKGHDNKF